MISPILKSVIVVLQASVQVSTAGLRVPGAPHALSSFIVVQRAGRSTVVRFSISNIVPDRQEACQQRKYSVSSGWQAMAVAALVTIWPR
jgi:hypothetical protein